MSKADALRELEAGRQELRARVHTALKAGAEVWEVSNTLNIDTEALARLVRR